MQNRLQDTRPQPAAQEKWFSRVGTVTLEENASSILPIFNHHPFNSIDIELIF
jgi:hypothetical protein